MVSAARPAPDDDLRGLRRLGGWGAIGSVALVAVQIATFSVRPPARTTPEVFALMIDDPVVGLLSLDALYLVNNLAVWLLYLGWAAALRTVSRSGVVLVVGLGTLQMAAYVASNPAAEMLTLARAHAAADDAGRTALEAAGEAVLAGWTGTAFLTYYLLGAVVLLLVARLLHLAPDAPRGSSLWAAAAGALMLVPSPFGVVGLVASLASLVPWCGLCLISARWLLGRSEGPDRETPADHATA